MEVLKSQFAPQVHQTVISRTKMALGKPIGPPVSIDQVNYKDFDVQMAKDRYIFAADSE